MGLENHMAATNFPSGESQIYETVLSEGRDRSGELYHVLFILGY